MARLPPTYTKPRSAVLDSSPSGAAGVMVDDETRAAPWEEDSAAHPGSHPNSLPWVCDAHGPSRPVTTIEETSPLLAESQESEDDTGHEDVLGEEPELVAMCERYTATADTKESGDGFVDAELSPG